MNFKENDKVLVNGRYDGVEFDNSEGFVKYPRDGFGEDSEIGIIFKEKRDVLHDLGLEEYPNRGYWVLKRMCKAFKRDREYLTKELIL